MPDMSGRLLTYFIYLATFKSGKLIASLITYPAMNFSNLRFLSIISSVEKFKQKTILYNQQPDSKLKMVSFKYILINIIN